MRKGNIIKFLTIKYPYPSNIIYISKVSLMSVIIQRKTKEKGKETLYYGQQFKYKNNKCQIISSD